MFCEDVEEEEKENLETWYENEQVHIKEESTTNNDEKS